MTQQQQKCHICHQRCQDGYACRRCADRAGEHLTTIATLARLADGKRARVKAIDYRTSGAARSSEAPIPHDPRVTQVLSPIVTGLAMTHDLVCEGIGWHHAVPRPAGVADVCHWLTGHTDWLRTKPEGVEELTFFERAASNLERLFDRPPDRLYLGRCEAVTDTTEDGIETTCEAHVYVEHAKVLAPQVQCPKCQATIDVAERREEFQDAVRGYQATMRELVNLAPMFLDEGVSRRTLHEWTRHRLLQPVGERLERDKEGRERYTPTYRIGDLGQARVDWEAIKAERGKKRERIGA